MAKARAWARDIAMNPFAVEHHRDGVGSRDDDPVLDDETTLTRRFVRFWFVTSRRRRVRREGGGSHGGCRDDGAVVDVHGGGGADDRGGVRGRDRIAVRIRRVHRESNDVADGAADGNDRGVHAGLRNVQGTRRDRHGARAVLEPNRSKRRSLRSPGGVVYRASEERRDDVVRTRSSRRKGRDVDIEGGPGRAVDRGRHDGANREGLAAAAQLPFVARSPRRGDGPLVAREPVVVPRGITVCVKGSKLDFDDAADDRGRRPERRGRGGGVGRTGANRDAERLSDGGDEIVRSNDDGPERPVARARGKIPLAPIHGDVVRARARRGVGHLEERRTVVRIRTLENLRFERRRRRRLDVARFRHERPKRGGGRVEIFRRQRHAVLVARRQEKPPLLTRDSHRSEAVAVRDGLGRRVRPPRGFDHLRVSVGEDGVARRDDDPRARKLGAVGDDVPALGGVTVGVTVCRNRTRNRTLTLPRYAGIRGRRLGDGHERRRAGLDRDPEPTSDGRGNRVAEGVPREDTNRRDAPASDGAVEPLAHHRHPRRVHGAVPDFRHERRRARYPDAAQGDDAGDVRGHLREIAQRVRPRVRVKGGDRGGEVRVRGSARSVVRGIEPETFPSLRRDEGQVVAVRVRADVSVRVARRERQNRGSPRRAGPSTPAGNHRRERRSPTVSHHHHARRRRRTVTVTVRPRRHHHALAVDPHVEGVVSRERRGVRKRSLGVIRRRDSRDAPAGGGADVGAEHRVAVASVRQGHRDRVPRVRRTHGGVGRVPQTQTDPTRVARGEREVRRDQLRRRRVGASGKDVDAEELEQEGGRRVGDAAGVPVGGGDVDVDVVRPGDVPDVPRGEFSIRERHRDAFHDRLEVSPVVVRRGVRRRGVRRRGVRRYPHPHRQRRAHPRRGNPRRVDDRVTVSVANVNVHLAIVADAAAGRNAGAGDATRRRVRAARDGDELERAGTRDERAVRQARLDEVRAVRAGQRRRREGSARARVG